MSKISAPCYDTNPQKLRVFREFCKNHLFLLKKGLFLSKNTKNFCSKSQSKIFSKKIIFQAKNFPKKNFLHIFLIKKFPIFSTLKILMHKNAIKKVGWVKFLEILAKNSCFSRVFWLFFSCFSCFFGLKFVFFKKKVLATLLN